MQDPPRRVSTRPTTRVDPVIANCRDMRIPVVADQDRQQHGREHRAFIRRVVALVAIGQSATPASKTLLTLRNSMKNGNWPSGVTTAAGSHSTWIRPRTYRVQSPRSLLPRPCVVLHPWGDSLPTRQCAANPMPARLSRSRPMFQLPFIG